MHVFKFCLAPRVGVGSASKAGVGSKKPPVASTVPKATGISSLHVCGCQKFMCTTQQFCNDLKCLFIW